MEDIGNTAYSEFSERVLRECCPVCHGKNFSLERKIRDHIDHSVFSVCHCRDCSLRFIVDPPSPEIIHEYYANEAGKHMHARGSDLHRSLRSILLKDELKPLLKRLPPGSQVIDYGAGDGFVSNLLHQAGYDVTALDMYPESEWQFPGIRYRQVDLNKPMPQSPDPAGTQKPARAVVIRHVLEHLHDPVAILSSLAMADANYVIIVVPNYKSLLRPILGEYWYYWDPPRHLACYTEKSLYCLAERCGYKLLEATTYAVDELVTSLHRRLLLKESLHPTQLSEALVRLTNPKSPLAALSSGIASFFGNCTIHVMLEKYHVQ